MAETPIKEIRENMINEVLSIFQIVYGADYSVNSSYITYIEELISSQQLDNFLEQLAEKHKSNQVVQDAKEQAISLLRELNASETIPNDSPKTENQFNIEQIVGILTAIIGAILVFIEIEVGKKK